MAKLVGSAGSRQTTREQLLSSPLGRFCRECSVARALEEPRIRQVNNNIRNLGFS
ncbi:hypothetical protein CIPAW_10G095600 [Carya illinoinensis]|uniref:Uncharacterized protein n=1 Tax=Carya illinoinensis TaxID=32201 RepID=A0A8T1PCD7_CARIL|nr:hypothetical protein CIPAW_10G095600 [Carya illinoinensis]